MLTVKNLGLFLGPVAFFLIRAFFQPEELSESAVAILAATVWIAIWWITEAIPIAATALLPIVLFPLTDGLSLQSTSASFGHPYVFLYVGGFILAIAIEKWNLHKRIALHIINLIGTNLKYIILGFMLATAFMSMWISNTATAVMMLPISLAIIKQYLDDPDTVVNENQVFGRAMMLAIAYSASIGGMATLIGTPPNLVLAGILKELYGIEISFAQWMLFGLPISLTLLAICWFYLVNIAFDLKKERFPGGKTEIKKQLQQLGKITYEEKMVLTLFVLTALSWISREYVLQPLLPKLDDTIIAMFAGVMVFLLPSSKKGEKLLNWEEAVRLPWGIVLLFGSGMAIAEGFKMSGLANWIGNQLTALDGMSIAIIVLIVIAGVNFLTEVTSNLATASMLLPILAQMSQAIDIHPYILMVAATLAASCAFMLPVATPPNAVVFGSGYLRIPDMVKTGLWLNLISIAVVALFAYFLLPLLWGFNMAAFPEELK
ncbi:MAG: DASS family sodium-coupled anion symporter [Saprospiraceae bacterium]|nr:DASS family sodium-coupled anion symporter [Saprospiraceae bacterium]